LLTRFMFSTKVPPAGQGRPFSCNTLFYWTCLVSVLSSLTIYVHWRFEVNVSPSPNMTRVHSLDVLTTDIKQLQLLLSSGRLRSTDLVDSYVSQIRKHDGYLHAMLSMPSDKKLKHDAAQLDAERDRGILRGPLHGIPIILKVSLLFKCSCMPLD
jgi:hypothetical protein